jgi:F-type H+-transporting ATPase subunit gamma
MIVYDTGAPQHVPVAPECLLFAVLHEMLYTSLMEENHHRVAHLERAVKHLDDQSVELARRSNVLRQEEIVEEIEVILLSASSLGERPSMQYSTGTQDTIDAK